MNSELRAVLVIRRMSSKARPCALQLKDDRRLNLTDGLLEIE